MKHEKHSFMTDKPISTLRDLVKVYGGTNKFAEFLKVVPSFVSNMLRDGELARGYQLEVYLDCQRRGIEIDMKALFGIENEAGGKSNPKHRAPARAA